MTIEPKAKERVARYSAATGQLLRVVACVTSLLSVRRAATCSACSARAARKRKACSFHFRLSQLRLWSRDAGRQAECPCCDQLTFIGVRT